MSASAKKLLLPLFMLGMCLSELVVTGCAARVSTGYRYRDPYYRNGYRVWDGREAGYYNTWVVETRRPQRDFRRLRRDEQRAYWTWRHNRYRD